jgi:hypothetical protein
VPEPVLLPEREPLPEPVLPLVPELLRGLRRLLSLRL